MQGAELEPASGGSWGPGDGAWHQTPLPGLRGPGLAGGGGPARGWRPARLPALGVPPVQADRRLLWLPSNQLNLGHLDTMAGAWRLLRSRGPWGIFASGTLLRWGWVAVSGRLLAVSAFPKILVCLSLEPGRSREPIERGSGIGSLPSENQG